MAYLQMSPVHAARADTPRLARWRRAAGGKLGAVLAAAALLLAATDIAAAAPARTTADLNLRTGPGTQYRIVTSMPRGSLVDVRECVRAWCEVGYRGRVGWASRRYLTESAAPVRPGPVRPGPVRPRPQEPVFPGAPLFPFPVPGFDARPPRPEPGPVRGACSERAARWLIGERATERRLEAALDASGARRLRVEEPGRFYTQEYRDDRLTVSVNRNNVVVDVECR